MYIVQYIHTMYNVQTNAFGIYYYEMENPGPEKVLVHFEYIPMKWRIPGPKGTGIWYI